MSEERWYQLQAVALVLTTALSVWLLWSQVPEADRERVRRAVLRPLAPVARARARHRDQARLAFEVYMVRELIGREDQSDLAKALGV